MGWLCRRLKRRRSESGGIYALQALQDADVAEDLTTMVLAPIGGLVVALPGDWYYYRGMVDLVEVMVEAQAQLKDMNNE